MAKIAIDGLHMIDGKGGWEGAVTKAYNINSIPAYYLIDKAGKFAMDKTPSPGSADALSTAIDKLLDNKPAK